MTGRRFAAGVVAMLGLVVCASAACAQDQFSAPVAGSAASVDPAVAQESGNDAVGFQSVKEAALQRLQSVALAADSAATMALARYFMRPEATAEDRVRGVAYLEQAAVLGLDEAHVWLGDIYRDGLDGIAPDFNKAASHYEVASANGDNTARRHHAALLLVIGDAAAVDRALALLGDAAAAGDIGAAIILADIHAEGRLVARDGAKALALYDLGVIAGNLDAIAGMADVYRFGAPGVAADAAQAVVLYEQASTLGDRGAKQTLAEMYILGQGVFASLDRGIALLEELAALGQTSALVNLGDIFANNEMTAADGQKAVDYYERAVEAGDFSSLIRIGDLYRFGTEGFAPDVVAAIPFYQEAADDGSNEARRALAEIFIAGAPGVAADAARAAELLQAAAEAGDTQAADLLARLLAAGAPTPQ